MGLKQDEWHIYMENDQSTQFQDSVFRTVIFYVCIIHTKEVAIFMLFPSWESEADFYLAQKNSWCDFSENTKGECLIHIIMRPHNVINAAGLSFNLSVEKCWCRSSSTGMLPYVGMWKIMLPKANVHRGDTGRNQLHLNKGRNPSVSFVLMGKRTRLQLCRDFGHYMVKCKR